MRARRCRPKSKSLAAALVRELADLNAPHRALRVARERLHRRRTRWIAEHADFYAHGPTRDTAIARLIITWPHLRAVIEDGG